MFSTYLSYHFPEETRHFHLKKSDIFKFSVHFLTFLRITGPIVQTVQFHQDSPDNMTFKVSLTAATIEEKRLWCHHLKRLMMENHPAPVPTAAKSKILNGKFIRRLAQGQCRVRMELNVKTNIPRFPRILTLHITHPLFLFLLHHHHHQII